VAVTDSKCMPCYNPLVAYRAEDKKVVFHRPPVTSAYHVQEPFNLPCGKCIGCRLNYAREWALRCVHEAKMHKNNSFITLTFNDEHLPKDGSLNVATFQRFMKRLRAGTKIKNLRFFHSGEYGEKYGRPHYHALIFGYDFPDKKIHYKNEKNPSLNLYTSEELLKYWPYGHNMIGNLTYESASYTARYILKKIKQDIDGTRGDKLPEYCTMSRMPGIGEAWYKKYGWTDCHANDRIAINRDGKTFYSRPPRFYDELLNNEKKPEFYNPELYAKIKKQRKENQEPPIIYRGKHGRLKTKEQVKTLQIERILRKLELDS
jgi:hypothetical protein